MQVNIISEQQGFKPQRKNQKGFSIFELIVAMIIFLIVSTAIWSVLRIAQQSRTTVNEKVNITKSIRFALNIIGRDTYNAGYGYPVDTAVVLKNNAVNNLLEIPDDGDNSRDTVPPVIAGNDITTNTFNTTPGVKTDQITLLFKDSTFNLIGDAGKEVSTPLNINAATTTSGIDEIVPVSGSNSSCNVNDILIINGNAGSTIGVVTELVDPDKIKFSDTDILDFNLPGSTGFIRQIVTPASMHRVIMVTYFVTADGILTRREFGNNSTLTATNKFVDEPLVYGVEDFQIQYVLDDGTLQDNPPSSILSKVRQVIFTIAVRSVELNSAGQPFRTSMSTTYSTRNLGYDAN